MTGKNRLISRMASPVIPDWPYFNWQVKYKQTKRRSEFRAYPSKHAVNLIVALSSAVAVCAQSASMYREISSVNRIKCDRRAE